MRNGGYIAAELNVIVWGCGLPLILRDAQRANAALGRSVRVLNSQVMGMEDGHSTANPSSNDVTTVLSRRQSLWRTGAYTV